MNNLQRKYSAGDRWSYFDVTVDIRKSSPVLSETAEVLYKTADYYAPQHERCILWNDPNLVID